MLQLKTKYRALCLKPIISRWTGSPKRILCLPRRSLPVICRCGSAGTTTEEPEVARGEFTTCHEDFWSLVFTQIIGTSDCFRNTIYSTIYIYIYILYIYRYVYISSWYSYPVGGDWNLTFMIFQKQLGMSSSQVTVSLIFLSFGSTTWDRHDMSWNGVTTGPNQPLNEDSTNPITWPWPVASCSEWEIQSANIEGFNQRSFKDDIVGYDGILIPTRASPPTIDGQHLPFKKWEHRRLIGLVLFGGWLNHDLSRQIICFSQQGDCLKMDLVVFQILEL